MRQISFKTIDTNQNCVIMFFIIDEIIGPSMVPPVMWILPWSRFILKASSLSQMLGADFFLNATLPVFLVISSIPFTMWTSENTKTWHRFSAANFNDHFSRFKDVGKILNVRSAKGKI